MAQAKNAVAMAKAGAAPGQKKQESKALSPAALVSLRNRFFYIYYRKLSLIFMAALALCAMSMISAVFFATRKTPPVYISVAPSGQIVPTYPLSEPSNKDPEVMAAWVSQWAQEGARRSLSYDYLNFSEQIDSAQSYFTYRGWDRFTKELTQSQNFNTVQQQKMIVKFTPKSAPQIKGTTTIQGRLAWAVWLEGSIQYVSHDGQNQGFRQNVMVKMIIVRMSTVDSPKGLGIDQIVIGELKTK
jgi:intracellular multiplication protein IcmL